MTTFITVSSAAGRGELLPVPDELEGETAIETAANFLREIAEEQKRLPASIRAFRPPLTIELEEVAV